MAETHPARWCDCAPNEVENRTNGVRDHQLPPPPPPEPPPAPPPPPPKPELDDDAGGLHKDPAVNPMNALLSGDDDWNQSDVSGASNAATHSVTWPNTMA
jgi:hypothetical protein